MRTREARTIAPLDDLPYGGSGCPLAFVHLKHLSHLNQFTALLDKTCQFIRLREAEA